MTNYILKQSIGSEFEFNKKTEPIGAGMSAQKSVQGSAIGPVSGNSITSADRKNNNLFNDAENGEIFNLQRPVKIKTIHFPGEAVSKGPSRYVQDDIQSNVSVSNSI